MTDLQILDTYGYTMCPARSEFPTLDQATAPATHAINIFDRRA